MCQSNNHQEKAYFFQHADPIIGKHAEMQRGKTRSKCTNAPGRVIASLKTTATSSLRPLSIEAASNGTPVHVFGLFHFIPIRSPLKPAMVRWLKAVGNKPQGSSLYAASGSTPVDRQD